MQLGQRIREARQQKGFSLGDLAFATQLSKGFLSQVESGRANPSLSSLSTIASSLGLPVHFLLTEEASPSVQPGPGVRIGRKNAWSDAGTGILKLDATTEVTMLVVTLPGDSFFIAGAASGDAGEGFCFVAAGAVTVDSGSSTNGDVAAGDSVAWPLGSSLALTNTGGTPARLLVTLPARADISLMRVEQAPGRARPLSATAQGPLRLVTLRAERNAMSVKR